MTTINGRLKESVYRDHDFFWTLPKNGSGEQDIYSIAFKSFHFVSETSDIRYCQSLPGTRKTTYIIGVDSGSLLRCESIFHRNELSVPVRIRSPRWWKGVERGGGRGSGVSGLVPGTGLRVATGGKNRGTDSCFMSQVRDGEVRSGTLLRK